MPAITRAAKETHIPVSFFNAHSLTALSGEQLSRYGVVLVLNQRPEVAQEVAQRLREARLQNPNLKILGLDRRDAQAALRKLGILEDPEILRRYWRYGGPTNFKRLLGYVAHEYLQEDHEVLPPAVMPEDGFYHPDAPDLFDDPFAYWSWYADPTRPSPGLPRVVMVAHQSFIILGDTLVVDAMIHAFESQGIPIAVIFASKEDTTRTLITKSHPQLLLSQRHSSLGRAADGETFVPAQLNVPYLKPISMIGSTIAAWRADPRGLSPTDIGNQVVIQEADGVIEPLVIGGLAKQEAGYRVHVPIDSRIKRFVARSQAWLNLRKADNGDKHIAIIYYSKSLGRADVGRGSPSGAYLNGPKSLMRVLSSMRQHGYNVEAMPKDEDELLQRMKQYGRNIPTWAPQELQSLVSTGDPVLIPLDTYAKWFSEKLSRENQAQVRKAFGPPPGKLMTVERGGDKFLVIPVLRMGNIVLTPQPVRGDQQDEELLHSRTIPPSHQYLAFYFWLQEKFGADAVVHFGTHGSLELLPLKAAGLSNDDWGDILIGNMPNIYPWIIDNLGEATLAKRRSYATLIDHLVPPIVAGELSQGLKTLHDDLDKFDALDAGIMRQEYRRSISEQARALDLDKDIPQKGTDRVFTDDEMHALAEYLHRLHNEQIPASLHVLGEIPQNEAIVPYIVSILGGRFLKHLRPFIRLPQDVDRIKGEAKKIIRAHAEKLLNAILIEHKTLASRLAQSPTPELEADIERAKNLQRRFAQTPNEIINILRAMNGEFIKPGPGNDPVRNSAALPTGRNLYTVNPEEIPTPQAWKVGRKLVDAMLTRALKNKGHYPKKVALDMNGFETMRHYGVTEAMAFYLVGCTPLWDDNRVVVDVNLIDIKQLRRPRIDVFIAAAGAYRDNFPSRMELLDKAVRLASAAKDAGPNYLREGTLRVEQSLRSAGFSDEDAAHLAPARVFGQAPGQYGTRILHLIPRSGVWDTDKDVEKVYRENMSYVYTRGIWGEKRKGLYEASMSGTDTILRTWASNMMSPLTNHHVYEYLGGLNMAVTAITGNKPEALLADVRDLDSTEIRSLEEVLRSELRARLFNEKWIRGMMAENYAGAGQMTELTKNTFGWAVTRPGSINDFMWSEIAKIYLHDKYRLGIQKWFNTENPHAQQEMAATLIEAARKRYWTGPAEEIQATVAAYVKSVAAYGPSNGVVGGDNHALHDFVNAQLNAPGNQVPQNTIATYAEKMDIALNSSPPVEGKIMEGVSPASTSETQTPVRAVVIAMGALIFLGFFARLLKGRR